MRTVMTVLLAGVLAAMVSVMGGCRGACVREGTLVSTPRGAVAIETLRPGDEVWTMGPGGTRERGTVVKVHRSRAEELVRIEAADGLAVEATGEHLVAVPGGWQRAKDLGEKATVIGEDGRPVDARVERRRDSARVYDLSVVPNENYFAGGVLVHNKTVSPPAAPWECAGAFGFFNAAGEYEQVVLEAGGMGKASTWGRSSDGVFAERGSGTVEWGIERRNIEIVRWSGTRVVWKFSGDVWEGLEGELAPAEGRRQKVVLRRPKDLRAMLELGGLPDAPVPPSTPSEARIVWDTDWPPVRPSKK